MHENPFPLVPSQEAGLDHPECALPGSVRALRAGAARGLFVGAQLFVSRRGRTLADFAIGFAHGRTPMTPDTIVPWTCTTKAVTLTGLLMLRERGLLSLEDPVCTHIPEFSGDGKSELTLRDLVLHTAGIDEEARSFPIAPSSEECLRKVVALPLIAGLKTRGNASYSQYANYMLLGEVIRRVDGRPVDRFVREEIFEPLDMTSCWLTMSRAEYERERPRTSLLFLMLGPEALPLSMIEGPGPAGFCSPGQSGRGPTRQLGHFFEALLGFGRRKERLLSRVAVAELTRPQRAGVYDERLRSDWAWGLGLEMARDFCSPKCSASAVGMRTDFNVSLMDPELELVVAATLNGFPPAVPFHARKLLGRVYSDLGINDVHPYERRWRTSA